MEVTGSESGLVLREKVGSCLGVQPQGIRLMCRAREVLDSWKGELNELEVVYVGLRLLGGFIEPAKKQIALKEVARLICRKCYCRNDLNRTTCRKCGHPDLRPKKHQSREMRGFYSECPKS